MSLKGGLSVPVGSLSYPQIADTEIGPTAASRPLAALEHPYTVDIACGRRPATDKQTDGAGILV
ncbi:MAG: hypothetical protein IPH35_18310 [Rhodoferax sp.]|nr:hypothetical protein [Rhodoferax sp.]